MAVRNAQEAPPAWATMAAKEKSVRNMRIMALVLVALFVGMGLVAVATNTP